MYRLVKQTQFCVSLIVLWSQNGSFETLQSCQFLNPSLFRSSPISVVFHVFERVSWWSFSVSTPFSLLRLILLTHFHKSASFRPNMLNCLYTTFSLGKQTKDNFINRKFRCRPAYSFIFTPGFLLGRVAGGAAL